MGSMRVLLLSAEYPPMEGGIGDYTRRLGQVLRERGVATPVLTTVGAIGAAKDSLEIHALVRDWGWGSLPVIARFLRQQRPDVLHLQYQTGAFRMHPAIHFLPDLLRRLPDAPYLVVTMHDLRLPYLFPKAGRLRHFLVARMLRLADVVVVTNGSDWKRLGGHRGGGHDRPGRKALHERDLLRPLTAGTLPRRPWIIPLGGSLPPVPVDYDREAWRRRIGLPAGGDGQTAAALVLGHFGLLHPSKGADLLIEALSRLRERQGRPVHLVVVGGGTGATDPGNVAFRESLRARIDELGLGEVVHWTGPCSDEEAAAFLRACDLVVLPYQDGASFRRSSLIAVLAVGCPVVTTEPLHPEAVSLRRGQPALEDGGNVALVPREDAAALAATVASLLENPARLGRLAEGASQLGQFFRWEEVGRQHVALYKELVQG